MKIAICDDSKNDLEYLVYTLYKATGRYMTMSQDKHIVITPEINRVLEDIKKNTHGVIMPLESGWQSVHMFNQNDDFSKIPLRLEDEFTDYSIQIPTSYNLPLRYYLDSEIYQTTVYSVFERKHRRLGKQVLY